MGKFQDEHTYIYTRFMEIRAKSLVACGNLKSCTRNLGFSEGGTVDLCALKKKHAQMITDQCHSGTSEETSP